MGRFSTEYLPFHVVLVLIHGQCIDSSLTLLRIQATRAMLGRMVFDAKKCERGIDALTMYKYEYNMERKILSAKPVHDWASHGADALRTGVGTRDMTQRRERPELPQVAII